MIEAGFPHNSSCGIGTLTGVVLPGKSTLIAASFAFSYLPVLNLISGGWAIIVITIIASAVAAWKFPIDVEEEV